MYFEEDIEFVVPDKIATPRAVNAMDSAVLRFSNNPHAAIHLTIARDYLMATQYPGAVSPDILLTSPFTQNVLKPSPFFQEPDDQFETQLVDTFRDTEGFEVAAYANERINRLEDEIKDICLTSPRIRETFDYMDQVKEAGLAQIQRNKAPGIRPARPQEFEQIRDRYYESTTGGANLSLGRLSNPDGTGFHHERLNRATRRAQNSDVYDPDLENNGRNRGLEQVVSEAELHVQGNLVRMFTDMVSRGENFYYKKQGATKESDQIYILSSNELERIQFQANSNNFPGVFLYLDNNPIIMCDRTRDPSSQNVGFVTFDLLETHVGTSTKLRNSYLLDNDQKSYIELATELKVNNDFAGFLKSIRAGLGNPSSINWSATFTNGDWDAMYAPWQSRDLVPSYISANQFTIGAIKRWLSCDSLFVHLPTAQDRLITYLKDYEKMQRERTFIGSDSCTKNASEFSDIQSEQRSLTDRIKENLRKTNAIPEAVDTHVTKSNTLATREGYEDVSLQVHYFVEGNPEALQKIHELSSLPEGLADTLCKEYRIPKSTIDDALQILVSSAAPVMSSGFAGDQNTEALRISTPQFVNLNHLVIKDSSGKIISPAEYKVKYNQYSGHYVILLNTKNVQNKAFHYEALVTPPDTENNERDILIEKKDFPIDAAVQFFRHIGWNGAEEELQEFLRNRKKISLSELGIMLQKNMIYGFSSEDSQYTYDNEGRLVAQCALARDVFSEVIGQTNGLEVAPLSISRKVENRGLEESGVALFSQNHTSLLVVKKGGFLRRTEAATFDITPYEAQPEVGKAESTVSNYFNALATASLYEDQPLPTPTVSGEVRLTQAQEAAESSVKAVKRTIYSLIRPEMKISDEAFEARIETAQIVNIDTIRDATPLSKITIALNLIQKETESGGRIEPSSEVQRIISLLERDEELYLEYLESKDPFFQRNIKAYFGPYIESSPLIFQVTRRLKQII